MAKYKVRIRFTERVNYFRTVEVESAQELATVLSRIENDGDFNPLTDVQDVENRDIYDVLLLTGEGAAQKEKPLPPRLAKELEKLGVLL